VWFKGHQDIARAIAREKELKGWRRAKKIALIESVNPVWTDLSRDWYEYEPADYGRALDRWIDKKQPQILPLRVRMTARWEAELRCGP
jgi:predicted methyltransferase